MTTWCPPSRVKYHYMYVIYYTPTMHVLQVVSWENYKSQSWRDVDQTTTWWSFSDKREWKHAWWFLTFSKVSNLHWEICNIMCVYEGFIFAYFLSDLVEVYSTLKCYAMELASIFFGLSSLAHSINLLTIIGRHQSVVHKPSTSKTWQPR